MNLGTWAQATMQQVENKREKEKCAGLGEWMKMSVGRMGDF